MSSSLSGINCVEHSRVMEELKELKSKLKEAEEEIEYKKEELELAITDNRFLRDEVAQKQSVIKGKDVLNKNLQKRNTKLQQERERLQSRYLQLQKERRNDRQKSNENMRGDLAKLQSELEECKTRESANQLKINDANALLEKRKKSQEFFRQRNRDFQQENDRIQSQLSHMKEELKAMEELRSKLVVAEEENKTIKNDLEIKTRDNALLRDEIEAKDSRIEESEARYNNLLESEKLLQQSYEGLQQERDCMPIIGYLKSQVELEHSLINRMINERNLRIITIDQTLVEYKQNIKRLKGMKIVHSRATASAILTKYKRIYAENDVKINAYMMKLLYFLQKSNKHLTEMLKTNNYDSNVEQLLKEQLTEFEELNGTSLVREFEHESLVFERLMRELKRPTSLLPKPSSID